MATLQFSQRASADLLAIGAYTIEQWGMAQAVRYLHDLEQCAKMLAGNPALGRACGWIRADLRRFEKGQHVLFYRLIDEGIVVSRVLHRSVLPERHGFDMD